VVVLSQERFVEMNYGITLSNGSREVPQYFSHVGLTQEGDNIINDPSDSIIQLGTRDVTERLPEKWICLRRCFKSSVSRIRAPIGGS
jgi:hypothetical protein